MCKHIYIYLNSYILHVGSISLKFVCLRLNYVVKNLKQRRFEVSKYVAISKVSIFIIQNLFQNGFYCSQNKIRIFFLVK